MDEILSLINKTNHEWYIRIIPEEHWTEPFLTRTQIDKMATFMDFYVLRQEEEIIAVGSFGTRDESTAWIPLMYVRTDFQRKGIGSFLMVYLEKMAKERNFEKVHLETDSEAEWALKFYRKHGYSIFKKDKNPWGYHVWLEKHLIKE